MTFTLVTGATSGIGAALVQRLPGPFILGGRNAVAEAPHVAWTHDLNDVPGVFDSLRALLESHEATVQTFIHCAGISRVLPMRDCDAEAAAEVMNVNVMSAMQIVRTLLKRNVNRGALEQVLFLSSVYAARGTKGQAVYAASKGAIDAMVRSLAIELAPNVRVNSIVAGGVPTPMSRRVFENDELRERSKDDYPLRLGEVQDIANAAEFLLSDRAGWITGTSMAVDGGFTARA